MKDNENKELKAVQEEEKGLAFNFQDIYMHLVLNWKWFILSLLVCLGIAFAYLRYAQPIYMANAKMLIKEENSQRGGRYALLYSNTLGTMSNSTGIDNEMEILSSFTLAEQVVKDLKLYTVYTFKGKISETLLYGNNPIEVDIDSASLEKLANTISLEIQRVDNSYLIRGTYSVFDEPVGMKAYRLERKIAQLPATISTKAGILTFKAKDYKTLHNGEILYTKIVSPKSMAEKFRSSFGVTQKSDRTSIALLSVRDENSLRAQDYLRQLVVCYNRQANMDKNEIAQNTEAFINTRLEKISAELGITEGQLEKFKKQNHMINIEANASMAMGNADVFDQKLVEANTQIALLSSVQESIKQRDNKYQTLPSNVGISDATVNQLINNYNELALQRNKLLRSSSESSPIVTAITSQMDDLNNSIDKAMKQAKRSLEIQRNSVASQFGKYQGQLQASPEQERILNQIGRQQDIKSSLYLMLLQKREDNSISLAATVDKGILIDNPTAGGKISPKNNLIYLLALLLGLGIPAIFIFLKQLFKYKIEGHEDVVKLTKLPILADVAVVSDTAKRKADIVVHENQNNQIEEIFRSMRTNLQFMLKEGEKVIMFTSNTSGEGKTFNVSNLAVSFALLGKKVILIGLDIRKPRLAELFEINDHHHGISTLLTKANVTMDDIQSQIVSSGVNNNLDLLMAGPIPPNPTELISRNSLELIIEQLKEKYDYILIDTAPVGLVTDTLQIARVANATVYVCRADYTPKAAFNLVNSLSAENKLPNIAIAINGIDMSKKKHAYYYGYGSYGKYGRYGSYGKNNHYSTYGDYSQSRYGNKNDLSVKR